MIPNLCFIQFYELYVRFEPIRMMFNRFDISSALHIPGMITVHFSGTDH